MLHGDGLSKSFGSVRVLTDIDITLESGELVALLGASGAGKSTLLRILSMIDTPDAGKVVLDGQDPGPTPWPDVTVVFQDLFLWPHLSNRENIELPLRARRLADSAAKVERVIEALELGSFIGRYPNQVSRGQRQAVAIARAIALSPRYLLLDEVTASLDVTRAARLAVLLRELTTAGTGILIITHQLVFARSWADRVVFLDGGRIGEQGLSAILDSPKSPSLREFVATLSRVS